MVGFLQPRLARIPIVATSPSATDRIGTFLARLGVTRNRYTVSPGLYGIGTPDKNSPIIVTANYKLSFDTVRYALSGQNVWLLVLDTCGINVWCAAGKGTFSTDELVCQVRRAELDQIVDHRNVIVPQLGATGIAAHTVKELCGFSVTFGPVRAADLARFFSSDYQVEPEMRLATFSLSERTVLVPVELYLLCSTLWWLLPLLFIVSGFGPSMYSFGQAWDRGLIITTATITGICSGAILLPLLLPFIPGKSFALKGFFTGILCGYGLISAISASVSVYDSTALLLWVCSVSSYLGMNFTGSTPFTSASGVEWEMKRAIPLQALATLAAAVFWTIGPFT